MQLSETKIASRETSRKQNDKQKMKIDEDEHECEDRKNMFFEFLKKKTDTKESHEYGPGAVEDGSSTENCKKKKKTLETDMPRSGAASHRLKGKGLLSPTFARVPGMAQGGPGHSQTLATTIPVGGATSTERGHATLAPAEGFRGWPFS